ncbi:hypothetical protein MNBD_CHLOROFLEXI01-657 [hydrothermal vent metagenome]|uniref:Uncharacterized protein n=1 Tax=hydrothermal vent metagenome TaxID=652676 RepID=A0A3B0WGW5_9ZZZZ
MTQANESEALSAYIAQMINQNVAAMTHPATTTHAVFKQSKGSQLMVLQNVVEVDGFERVFGPDIFANCLTYVNEGGKDE